MKGIDILFNGLLLTVTGVICLVISELMTHDRTDIYHSISLFVFGVGGIIMAVGTFKTGKEMGWC